MQYWKVNVYQQKPVPTDKPKPDSDDNEIIIRRPSR